MEKDKLEYIATNLLMFFPLFYKKLMKGGHAHSGTMLSNPQYSILGMLNGRGPLPTSEIGKNLYISKPNMTALIDKLIEDGNVERLPDKNDRRIVNIAITDKGKHSLKEHKTTVKAIIKKNLSSLSEKDHEVLYESLEKMRAVFSRIGEEGV